MDTNILIYSQGILFLVKPKVFLQKLEFHYLTEHEFQVQNHFVLVPRCDDNVKSSWKDPLLMLNPKLFFLTSSFSKNLKHNMYPTFLKLFGQHTQNYFQNDDFWTMLKIESKWRHNYVSRPFIFRSYMFWSLQKFFNGRTRQLRP